jgi:oligogalacturonide lyase
MHTLPRCLFLCALGALRAFAADDSGNQRIAPPPVDWIDADTGHRVIQLSSEPGSTTLYFHDNAYTPEGDKFIFNAPGGLAMVDVTRLGVETLKPEVIAPESHEGAMARRARTVYFSRGRGEVYAYDLASRQIRRVPNATRPIFNADDSLTVATVIQTDPSGKTPKPAARPVVPQLGRMFPGKTMAELTPEQRAAVQKEDARSGVFDPLSEALVFTNVRTGESKTVGYQYAALDHLQFSPTDPNLLLYCHEGPWHEVDRIWTIRADGSEMTLRHARTMDMETASNEFWSYDGRSIWFDLQTPRSQHVWLANVDLTTGKETHYHMRLNWWSTHYNVSRDNMLLCGDGSDPTQVAFAKDGKWINLYRVQPDGTLARELLVNLAKQNYAVEQGGIEPNASITPDNKWVIFSGNMFGVRHVYAVEIAKARP